MPKYFFNDSNNPNDKAPGQLLQLNGDTAHHLIRVLRIRTGGKIIVCDGKETDYHCIIESINQSKSTVECQILSKIQCKTEPTCKIRLFQAMPKSDKLEWIIQKSVELGVHEIIPMDTEHSIKKNTKQHAKLERFQKISESAAGQSMRGIIPKIHSPMSWDNALMCSKGEFSIAAYEKEELKTIKSTLKRAENISKIDLWIGPEGGFSKNEITTMEEMGFHLITLGARILRTETAAITTIAKILMETEGF